MPAAIQSRILRLPVWYLEIKNYNLVLSFIWVGNVSHIQRTAPAEDVREKGYEKDVWASECGSTKRLEKTAR